MPLDVTLGGLPWRWQLKDDDAVEDWLCRRPWLANGGVAIVQAPDDQTATVAALERAVFSADCGFSDVRVVSLPANSEDLFRTLVSWLNTSHERPREIALALAADLDVRPAVFVVDARGARTNRRWAEDAVTLCDLAAKLEVSRCPTIVVLHLRGESPLRGRYDLHRGWPVGLARSILEDGPTNLWQSYVHLRLAWETGGVVDDSVECAAMVGELCPENDDLLEDTLNRFATSKLSLLPAPEKDAWMHYVQQPSAAEAPTVFGYPEHADGRLTPFPWLARALLLQHAASGNMVRALRSGK
ncbi:MAG: hypothetical protein IPM35_16660 [Myxococcales bacterium]|nr:hypothetical protein [Myxococcales bacterium]